MKVVLYHLLIPRHIPRLSRRFKCQSIDITFSTQRRRKSCHLRASDTDLEVSIGSHNYQRFHVKSIHNHSFIHYYLAGHLSSHYHSTTISLLSSPLVKLNLPRLCVLTTTYRSPMAMSIPLFARAYTRTAETPKQDHCIAVPTSPRQSIFQLSLRAHMPKGLTLRSEGVVTLRDSRTADPECHICLDFLSTTYFS
jgi:hypothetical protein